MSSGVLWDYFQSLIATVFFVSNFLFTLENNYFDISSNYKPFIHTWSLAIEEQYYLFIPLITYLFWRYKLRFFFSFIILLWVVSFSICYFNDVIKITVDNGTVERLNSAGWGSFFMPFGRYWELIAGSIVALILDRYDIKKSNFLSLVGLITIIFSFFYLNETMKYPSLFTLLPTLSTVLIIIFSSKNNNYVGKFLSNKTLVFIGLISYSLYLWHQPIFSLFNFIYFEEQTLLIKIVQLFLISLFSFITWKYIEKPFRNFSIISTKKIWICFFIFSTSIIIFSSFGLSKYGRESHLKILTRDIDVKYLNMVIDMKLEGEIAKNFSFSKDTKFSNRNLFIIGDSQVGNWERAINISNEKYDFNIKSIGLDSVCYKYINKKTSINKNYFCQKMIKNLLEIKSTSKGDLVIILESYLYSGDIQHLTKLIKYIKKFNKNIIILGNAEFSNFTLLSLDLAKKLSTRSVGEEKLNKIFYIKKNKSTIYNNYLLEIIAKENDVKYFSEFNFYCEKKNECQLLSSDFNPYFYDNMHLTNPGAKYVGKKIIKFIEENL